MFTKLIHFAKMSWMLFWRFTIIGVILFGGRYNDAIFWGSLIAAGIMVFVFNRTLLTWPIVRLIMRKQVVIPANGWAGDHSSQRPTQSAPSYAPNHYAPQGKGPGRPHLGPIGGPSTVGTVQVATENGRITGFEPRTLQSRPVPKMHSMIGAPGAGLQGAQGMAQINIDLGVQGEENFARALAATNQLHRFSTIWSVPVPDFKSFTPGKYDTDIDCIVATSTAIFLVDLKNYKSGNVRYTSQGDQLYCEDVPTGQAVGQPKKMSHNMEMATAAVRNHFPKANIVPVVVFMPTDKGEGVLENVVWPGGIPAMNLTEFLSVLAQQQDFSWNLPHGGAVSRLANFAKVNGSKV